MTTVMKFGRTAMLAAAFAVMTAGPALATASLTCAIDDANIAFSLLANTGREDLGHMQVIGGSLKIKSAKVGKVGLETEFKDEQRAQHWIYGKELRLGFRFDELLPDAAISLVLIGSLVGDSRYTGRYELKVSRDGKTQTFSGRIKECDNG